MPAATHLLSARRRFSIATAGWLMPLLMLLAGPPLRLQQARAQQAPLPENEVKAAFILNFPKYVEWPPSALTANAPITIAVCGNGNIAEALVQMIKDRKVDGHPLQLKKIAKPEELTSEIHILFIAGAPNPQAATLLQKLADVPVLTVGESEDFLNAGGMINLARQDKKITLEINLGAATRAGVKVSSKLLAVARLQKDKSP